MPKIPDSAWDELSTYVDTTAPDVAGPKRAGKKIPASAWKEIEGGMGRKMAEAEIALSAIGQAKEQVEKRRGAPLTARDTKYGETTPAGEVQTPMFAEYRSDEREMRQRIAGRESMGYDEATKRWAPDVAERAAAGQGVFSQLEKEPGTMSRLLENQAKPSEEWAERASANLSELYRQTGGPRYRADPETRPEMPGRPIEAPALEEYGADTPIKKAIWKASQEFPMVPYKLLERMASTESSFNLDAVSPKGAQGLFQIMPSTFYDWKERYGDQLDWFTDYKDPYQSAKFAAFYINEMLKKYGDYGSALAAYNAGPGAVDRYGGVPPPEFSDGETWNYVNKILAGIEPELLKEDDLEFSRRAAEAGAVTAPGPDYEPPVEVENLGTWNNWMTAMPNWGGGKPQTFFRERERGELVGVPRFFEDTYEFARDASKGAGEAVAGGVQGLATVVPKFLAAAKAGNWKKGPDGQYYLYAPDGSPLPMMLRGFGGYWHHSMMLAQDHGIKATEATLGQRFGNNLVAGVVGGVGDFKESIFANALAVAGINNGWFAAKEGATAEEVAKYSAQGAKNLAYMFTLLPIEMASQTFQELYHNPQYIVTNPGDTAFGLIAPFFIYKHGMQKIDGWSKDIRRKGGQATAVIADHWANDMPLFKAIQRAGKGEVDLSKANPESALVKAAIKEAQKAMNEVRDEITARDTILQHSKTLAGLAGQDASTTIRTMQDFIVQGAKAWADPKAESPALNELIKNYWVHGNIPNNLRAAYHRGVIEYLELTDRFTTSESMRQARKSMTENRMRALAESRLQRVGDGELGHMFKGEVVDLTKPVESWPRELRRAMEAEARPWALQQIAKIFPEASKYHDWSRIESWALAAAADRLPPFPGLIAAQRGTLTREMWIRKALEGKLEELGIENPLSFVGITKPIDMANEAGVLDLLMSDKALMGSIGRVLEGTKISYYRKAKPGGRADGETPPKLREGLVTKVEPAYGGRGLRFTIRDAENGKIIRREVDFRGKGKENNPNAMYESGIEGLSAIHDAVRKADGTWLYESMADLRKNQPLTWAALEQGRRMHEMIHRHAERLVAEEYERGAMERGEYERAKPPEKYDPYEMRVQEAPKLEPPGGTQTVREMKRTMREEELKDLSKERSLGLAFDRQIDAYSDMVDTVGRAMHDQITKKGRRAERRKTEDYVREASQAIRAAAERLSPKVKDDLLLGQMELGDLVKGVTDAVARQLRRKGNLSKMSEREAVQFVRNTTADMLDTAVRYLRDMRARTGAGRAVLQKRTPGVYGQTRLAKGIEQFRIHMERKSRKLETKDRKMAGKKRAMYERLWDELEPREKPKPPEEPPPTEGKEKPAEEAAKPAEEKPAAEAPAAEEGPPMTEERAALEATFKNVPFKGVEASDALQGRGREVWDALNHVGRKDRASQVLAFIAQRNEKLSLERIKSGKFTSDDLLDYFENRYNWAGERSTDRGERAWKSDLKNAMVALGLGDKVAEARIDSAYKKWNSKMNALEIFRKESGTKGPVSFQEWQEVFKQVEARGDETVQRYSRIVMAAPRFGLHIQSRQQGWINIRAAEALALTGAKAGRGGRLVGGKFRASGKLDPGRYAVRRYRPSPRSPGTVEGILAMGDKKAELKNHRLTRAGKLELDAWLAEREKVLGASIEDFATKPASQLTNAGRKLREQLEAEAERFYETKGEEAITKAQRQAYVHAQQPLFFKPSGEMWIEMGPGEKPGSWQVINKKGGKKADPTREFTAAWKAVMGEENYKAFPQHGTRAAGLTEEAMGYVERAIAEAIEKNTEPAIKGAPKLDPYDRETWYYHPALELRARREAEKTMRDEGRVHKSDKTFAKYYSWAGLESTESIADRVRLQREWEREKKRAATKEELDELWKEYGEPMGEVTGEETMGRRPPGRGQPPAEPEGTGENVPFATGPGGGEKVQPRPEPKNETEARARTEETRQAHSDHEKDYSRSRYGTAKPFSEAARIAKEDGTWTEFVDEAVADKVLTRKEGERLKEDPSLEINLSRLDYYAIDPEKPLWAPADKKGLGTLNDAIRKLESIMYSLGDPDIVQAIGFHIHRLRGKVRTKYEWPGQYVAGVYHPKSRHTAIRKMGDVETAAHEVFHDLMYKVVWPAPEGKPGDLTALSKALSEYEGELGFFAPFKLTPEMAKNANERFYYRSEAFAEYGRVFVMDFAKAQQYAPNLTKLVHEKMDAITPDGSLWAAFKELQHWMNERRNLNNAKTIVEMNISTTPKVRRAMHLANPDFLIQHLIDDAHVFRYYEEVANLSRKKKGLPPIPFEQSPYRQFRLYRGYMGKVESSLLHNTVAFKTMRPNGKGFAQILTEFKKFHPNGEWNELAGYLYALRQYELSVIRGQYLKSWDPVSETGELRKVIKTGVEPPEMLRAYMWEGQEWNAETAYKAKGDAPWYELVQTKDGPYTKWELKRVSAETVRENKGGATTLEWLEEGPNRANANLIQEKGGEVGYKPKRRFVQEGSIQHIASEMHLFQDRILQYVRDAGMLDAELYNQIKLLNNFYVPLFPYIEHEPHLGTVFRSQKIARAMEKTVLMQGRYFSGLVNPRTERRGGGPERRLSNLPNATRPIGSGGQYLERVNPLESIVKNTHALISLAERNSVMQTIVDAAHLKGVTELGEMVSMPLDLEKRPETVRLKEIEDEIRKGMPAAALDFMDSLGLKLDMERVATFFRPHTMYPKNKILVFRNGKRELYHVHEDLYKVVMNLTTEEAKTIRELGRLPAATLRAGATVFNPEFWVKNPIRDALAAFMYSEYGKQIQLGKATLTLPTAPFKPLTEGIRELIQARNAKVLDNESGRIFKEWMQAGGGMASFFSIDRVGVNNQLMEIYAKAKNGDRKAKLWYATVGDKPTFMEVVNRAKDLARKAGEFSEQANRLGEYKKVRNLLIEREWEKYEKENPGAKRAEFDEWLWESGRRKAIMKEAAFASREVTLDFAKMGQVMRTYGQMAAFLTANINGVNKAFQLFRREWDAGRPIGMGYALGRMALGVSPRVGGIAAITLAGIALRDMFPSHKEAYKNLPDYEKNLFWHVPIPMSLYSEDGPQFIRVPKPFELGILYGSSLERVYDFLEERNPEALTSILRSLNLNWNQLMPTFLVPPYEVTSGQSTWSGMPLVPYGQENLLDWRQFTPSTSPLARSLSATLEKWLVPMTFEYWDGVKPVSIDAFLRGYFGQIGHYAGGAFGVARALSNPPAREIGELPLVRAFVTKTPSSSQAVSTFYERFKRAEKVARTFGEHKGKGQAGEAVRVIREYGDYYVMAKVMAKFSTKMSEINKIVKSLNDYNYKGPLSPLERKRVVRNLRMIRHRLAIQGNELYNRVVHKEQQ